MAITTKTDRTVLRPSDSYPTLFVLFSPETGISEQAEALREGKTFIGREISRADGLVFPHDEKLSRRHVLIECRATPADEIESGSAQADHRVQIVDMESKNGCFVNGQLVSEQVLYDGDVIRVGNTVLLLRWQPTGLEDGPELGLLGRSARIALLRHRVQLVATNPDCMVLLLGEPGVGKELVAQSLHRQSGRSGEFTPFNCANLSDTLADKELFGHERGAFTGADRRSDGLFRAAHNGTLFLDEVGELHPVVQAKLLRVLQERTIVPVGGTRPIPVNVRVVTATNRDMESEVRAGRFRDDLYSRLRGEVIDLPSLRERREDVLLLLQQFMGAQVQLTPRLATALIHYSWPHNVRELKQMAETLRHALNRGQALDLPLVSGRFRSLSAPTMHPSSQKPEQERSAKIPAKPASMPSERLHLEPEHLRALLAEKRGNVSAVARVLQRSRRQVRRWMDKFGLS